MLKLPSIGLEHFIQSKASGGKLIMPFGSGKSLPAYFLAQEIGAKRILIAVPSLFLILFLIRQTIEVWLREMLANRQDVDWICVCSGESAWHVDRDDVAVLRQILGVPCLTDSEKISVWLRKSQMACRFISQPTRAVNSCPRPLEAQGSDLTSASWLRLTRPEEKGDPLYPSPPRQESAYPLPILID